MVVLWWLLPALLPKRKNWQNRNTEIPYKSSIFQLLISGKAKVCNTSIPGSIPGGTSSKKGRLLGVLFCWSRHSFIESGFLAPRGRKKSGSHTPPEDRRAACAARHSPGAGRGYSRQRRDSGTQDTFQVSFFAGGATPSSNRALRAPRAQEIRFAYPARRASGSLLISGEGEIYSPKAKFRNPPTMYLDKKDANRHFRVREQK